MHYGQEAMPLILELPTWLTGLLTIGFFVGASLVGLALSRVWSRRRGLHALVDNGVIGWIFSAILGIYAIAIGLIAVATWGNSSEASAVASHEAASLGALFRDVSGYPDSIRGDLQRLVREYTTDVIETEWPLQQAGEIPTTGGEILDRLENRLYAFEPDTDGQEAVHAEGLDSFNQVVEDRRQRLEAVDYAVPKTLWGVVLAGAAIAIVASFVFNIESFQVHALMTCLLAAMIGLLVFFIIITDHPYHGPGGVSPEAYQLLLRDLIDPRLAH